MDADRLATLLDAHAAALELFAARWGAAPEDCVQEAFVELARQVSEPENVVAWLYRVVRNRAINAARGDRRRRDREQAVARLRPVATARSVSNVFDAATIAESLGELPGHSSEIIILRIWSELSFEEIASVLACSVSTAHRRYRRALEQLRTMIEVTSCPPENQTPNRSLPKS